MPIRRFTIRLGAAAAGQRLDEVVREWLEEAAGRAFSKAVVRRLIMSGAILVDGRPARRPGMTLTPGLRLAAALDDRRLEPAHRPPPGDAVTVLFEDSVLIAVAKPPGLAVHASADRTRADLYSLVRRQLARRAGGGEASLPYLGLHHRLDIDTSGVVLFTKSPAANAGLATQFESRSVEKVYHALTVTGAAGGRSEWRAESRLGPVGKGRHARMAGVEQGGAPAVTWFAVLQRLRGALLVEARPETGRKHQIRAHLREGGLPILGDVRYDGPSRVGTVAVARPMLHAHRLALLHPLSHAPLEIVCHPPEDFRRLLAQLAAPIDTATSSR